MPIPVAPLSNPPSGFVVALDDVKAHLQILGSANDAELTRFLNVATAAIGRVTAPLLPLTVTGEKHNGGRDRILLNYTRAISITVIAYTDGTTANLTDVDLDGDTGIIYLTSNARPACFPRGTRNVLVSYVAGFATVDPDLAHAVLELTRHLWATQRPNSAGVRPGFADEPPTNPVAGAHTTWPTRVQELIGPFMVPKIA